MTASPEDAVAETNGGVKIRLIGSKVIVCGRRVDVIENAWVASGAIPLCAVIVPAYVTPPPGK